MADDARGVGFMNSDPAVSCSVIMPCFNSRRFIANSIDSVLAQTAGDWELIIVDDGSTDDSVAFIRDHYACRDPRIRLECLAVNAGAAVARNRGIDLARGQFIAFLDSDDIWYPEKLETQRAFMQAHGCSFSFTGYRRVDEGGRALGRVDAPGRVDYGQLLGGNVIGCLTAMYDARQLGKIYMPLIRKRQDFGLWLRILKATPFAYGVPQLLARYTVRQDSLSADKRAAARYTWKLYREVERLSVWKSLYYFCRYAVRGLLRTRRAKSSVGAGQRTP